MRGQFLGGLLLMTLVATACYLPRADVDRAVETFVLASVLRCSTEGVGGNLVNDSEVPIRVVLRPQWLDLSSEVYHETEHEVPRVEAKTTIPWDAPAGEEIDPPLICQAETVTVEALE